MKTCDEIKEILWTLLVMLQLFAVIVSLVSIHDKPIDVESVLRWLPESAHNIFVVRAPLTYYVGNCQPIDPESLFEYPIVASILRPPDKAPWHGIRWIEPRDICWCAATFDGQNFCTFGVLTKDYCRDRALQRNMMEYADAEHETFGDKIYEFDSTNFAGAHYTCLLPGLILCSNNQDYLSLVLMRRHSHAAQAALKRKLPEWKTLDRKSSYWGIWNFTADEAAILDEKQPDGHGYSFEYQKSSRRLRFCYWLPKDAHIPPLAKAFLEHPESGFESYTRYCSAESQLDQLVYTFAADRSGGTAALSIMSPLGGALLGQVQSLKEWQTRQQSGGLHL